MCNSFDYFAIMPFCELVVAKIILVPCSVSKQLKRDNSGHGEVTINNAATVIIYFCCHKIANIDLVLKIVFILPCPLI